MIQISVWEKESFFAPSDIVIAGSGLVGLWSAYYLKRANPKLRITIAERGLIPTGASTRNAGFACFGSLTELIADSREIGEDRTLELVEMRYRGLKRITKTFSNKAIGYEDFGGYELIGDHPSYDINNLRSAIDYYNRRLKNIVKQQKTFKLQTDKLNEFGFAGMRNLIVNKSEAQLHSGKLCQALLRLVQSMGVTVLTGIEITGFQKNNESITLYTTQTTDEKLARPTIELSTRQLLVCTNAFAKQILPDLDVIPARGQVLVTSPIDDLLFKGAFHYNEGYYYFRNIGNRVLLGGARNTNFDAERSEEMVTTEGIQQHLHRFLQEVILPGKGFSIDYSWSGIMGMGIEKQPNIGEVEENVFCAIRLGGMGVALSPLVGEKVAKMMTGKQH